MAAELSAEDLIVWLCLHGLFYLCNMDAETQGFSSRADYFSLCLSYNEDDR